MICFSCQLQVIREPQPIYLCIYIYISTIDFFLFVRENCRGRKHGQLSNYWSGVVDRQPSLVRTALLGTFCPELLMSASVWSVRFLFFRSVSVICQRHACYDKGSGELSLLRLALLTVKETAQRVWLYQKTWKKSIRRHEHKYVTPLTTDICGFNLL